MKTRRYSELRRLPTFDERFDYLAIGGEVGKTTFGFDRWVNQLFYRSREWRQTRDEVIVRDGGCDLGLPGYDLVSDLLVHHMNPLTIRDIENQEEWILDPQFLITTSLRTHNAIHYGDRSLLPTPFVERVPGDTRLW